MCPTPTMSSLSRWFDKHQFIVFANGRSGMNIEHAPGDGTTMLRMLTHTVDVANKTAEGPVTAPPKV